MVALTSARSAESRTAGFWCSPNAQTPTVSNGWGQAWGGVNCGAAVVYDYTIRLSNRAGDTLAQASGQEYDTALVYSPWAVCTGAYVHSFLYENDEGYGSSDTSPENSSCAY
jgi:hypothetical protein